MFSRNKSNVDIDPRRGDVFDAIKNDMRREEKEEAAKPAPAPARPADTPPRAFIETTRKSLSGIHEKYSAELEALDKDIAKLREERRQIVVALHGVTAALSEIKKADEDPTATKPAPTPNVAQYPINAGTNSAGQPAVSRLREMTDETKR